jgi:aerobic-type carbon monoxide dehydrogenase small subunit (CoxS/CutS family)
VPETPPTLSFEVDGRPVSVPDEGLSLLDVLRERLGLRSPKDGCSPQGQCGCCTVLVDGQPRVACVTPARRVRGRAVTTLDGLPAERRQVWADAFCATGASQCGFCTPGIVVRLEGLAARGTDLADAGRVEQALLAHLCRCTGWRSILDAAASVSSGGPVSSDGPVASGGPVAGEPMAGVAVPPGRDLAAASRRAEIEGRGPQAVSTDVALGRGGFADDRAPADALVAVPDGAGGWAVGSTLAEARAASGKVQGRRTTVEVTHPVEPPPGDWAATLRTTWVEPAYLELDASWCAPGGTPASPLANGGAFGGKRSSDVGAVARALADEHGRPVRVVLSREDAVRTGPKRPPVAGGVRPDGTGVLRVARTPGIAAAVAAVAPGLVVEEVDVAGPPTSVALRAAGWAEAVVLLAGAGSGALAAGPAPGVLEASSPVAGAATVTVRSPDGATATASVTLGPSARVAVHVRCGDPLDEVVLRSYCLGATHMALGWACTEALAVDAEGAVHDLTIRSFGVLRAADTPPIDVTVSPDDGPPVNGSDAAFAAVAAATWLAQGRPTAWPTGTRPRG